MFIYLSVVDASVPCRLRLRGWWRNLHCQEDSGDPWTCPSCVTRQGCRWGEDGVDWVETYPRASSQAYSEPQFFVWPIIFFLLYGVTHVINCDVDDEDLVCCVLVYCGLLHLPLVTEHIPATGNPGILSLISTPAGLPPNVTELSPVPRCPRRVQPTDTYRRQSCRVTSGWTTPYRPAPATSQRLVQVSYQLPAGVVRGAEPRPALSRHQPAHCQLHLIF